MPSDFQRYAIQRLIDKATEAGHDVPAILLPAGDGPHASIGHASYAAAKWAELHPDDDPLPCCMGVAATDDPLRCGCWRPVYDVDQAPARVPGSEQEFADAVAPWPDMCPPDAARDDTGCAFRPGSPERAEEWTADALYEAAREGRPFWCHRGMRRPVKWVHPDGREVPGSPDDWHPLRGPLGLMYQANGEAARLCTGWAAVAGAAALPRIPTAEDDA